MGIGYRGHGADTPTLGGSPEMNAAGDVLVATGTEGRIAGVVALATGMRRAVLDFEPRHIRGRSPPAQAVAEANDIEFVCRRRAASAPCKPSPADTSTSAPMEQSKCRPTTPNT